jgi:hypothetical protein
MFLLFAATSEVTGLLRRMRFRGWVAWVAGCVVRALGRTCRQPRGGIRSAALLGFDLSKEKFVGTATAIALFVDDARLPVYLANQGAEMLMLWQWIVLGTVGVVAGTVLGSRVLKRVPEVWFRRVLAVLGVVMLARAFFG